MKRRKLLTTVVATGAVTATVALSASPATATPRTFVVTLVGGAQVTLTVDVPPGTPVDAISFPGLQLPVASVQEITAPAATPGVGIGTATPEPGAPAAPSTPAPDPTAIPEGAPGFTPKPESAPGQGGGSQETSRRQPGAAGLEDLSEELVTAVTEERGKERSAENPNRNVDGSPTVENPAYSLALPGAAPIGVPNFFIDKFRIPPFLLPIYQAAGIEYGVRWEVLAAINEIETDYGRNLNVSSAGAMGWMQFIPSSWKAYGVDANEDGVKDPYNPVDAIFAAARYLRAAGAETDLRKAIFAYNHADWYVDSVMLRARVLGGLPSNFVGSLTGLTQGHFPVAARATYADDISEVQVAERKRMKVGNAAWAVDSATDRRSINIYSKNKAPVIAVNDGKIVSVSADKVVLEDVYGNTYTYDGLGSTAKLYPAAKARTTSLDEVSRELELPDSEAAPTAAASGTTRKAAKDKPLGRAMPTVTAPKPTGAAAPLAQGGLKERLFANPLRPSATKNGGSQQILEGKAAEGSFEVFRASVSSVFGINTKSKDVTLKPLRPGAKVIAGTILGRLGKADRGAPRVTFSIKPAGRGAPQIDPKPILDGWKLLESTAIYRAAGENPFSKTPSIGQVLLMDKESLQRMVLGDPRIEIYGCGREDVQLGQIDRRVLATLEYLSLSGFKPTVTSLKCGHSFLTASGNVSHHSSGNAVDIAKVNGVPILGNQGAGSITEIVVQRLATLQGLMRPAQIISLMELSGADNTLSMGDHADHIHVGFQPLYGTNSRQAKQVNAILKPDQWIKLVDRLNEIDQPIVPTEPSKAALKVAKASDAD